MPKGKIQLVDGREILYDDIYKEGEILVVKISHTHEVITLKVEEINEIKIGEKHRTIVGYCKKLTKEEINQALKNVKI